jgi:hypothetical protein
MHSLSSIPGEAFFVNPHSSQIPSSKPPFGTESAQSRHSPRATATFIVAADGYGHAPRGRHQHHRRDGKKPSTRTLADASNSSQADSHETRRKQRTKQRSSSTPAGNRHTRKDTIHAWYPTQPIPPGRSWYLPRQDPSKPRSNYADAKMKVKTPRHRRASFGSQPNPAVLKNTQSVDKGTGGMRGWYTAVCKRFGVTVFGP